MKKTKMQLFTAAVLAAGVMLLGGCQNQTALPETTAVTEASAETATEDTTETSAEFSAESTAETVTETSSGAGADTAAAAEGVPGAVAEDALFGSFQTITLEGEEISQDLFGQAGLSMVNIWGTFCPPCIREMPDLGELSHEYGGDDFQMIGLLSDVMEAGDATALDIIEQTGADYTHILINQELYDNYLIGVQVVPTTVFIDREGRQVGEVYAGAKSKKQWEDIILQLMEETKE